MTEYDDAVSRRSHQVRDYKRTMIREAAKAVFVDKGIDGASMRQIAKVAGWTTGALYQYFESKEDLYAEVLRDSLIGLHRHVSSAAEHASTGKTRAALHALWSYYDAHSEEFDLGFYLYNGTKPVGLNHKLDRELNAKLDDTVRTIADSLVLDGFATVSDAHRLAMAHTTSVFGLVLVTKTGRLRTIGEGHSPEDLLEVYFAHLVSGG